ncbi:MAG: sialate O-acetylesterase [Patescibacteria group bacterium]|nr:sialate O-acetylesterase [Patescibacteria group bacterium]
MKQILLILSLLLLVLTTSPAVAAVKLPAVISDNMVLQRNTSIPVWGTADQGEIVTVTFGNQKATTTTGNDGKWMVKLDRMDAGGPYEMTVSGTNTITIRNILIGEVWICSGQSNMERPVKEALNADREIAESDYPEIRFLSVPWTLADKPLDDITVGKVPELYKKLPDPDRWINRLEGPVAWISCNPKAVENFSAAGYFFGRELHKKLNVPVGLIQATWDGSSISGWTSLPTLRSYKEAEPILNRWGQAFLYYPWAKEEYEKRIADWQQSAKKAELEGKTVLPKPWIPPLGPEHHHRPSGLYNGMIAPLIPFAIKGVIWYQGEADAPQGYLYRTLFPAMIRDWRESWGQGDFPFLYAQLANFNSNVHLYRQEIPSEPSDDYWAELREAQLMTLALPKTGMAVTIDIGEADNIHPRNKQEVGYRLALAAQAVAYNRNVIYSGPAYESMNVENGKVRISFKHIGSGLIAKDGEPLKGFAIAGRDRKFVWAEAKIEGNEVVVWSDKVSNPIAVRYAWACNPACNLYNKEGLPASPFRTDNWVSTLRP